MNHYTSSLRLCVALTVLLVASASLSWAAEGGAPAAPAKSDDTNAPDTLRSFLHLQEQLHATQMAIERSRQEASDAAARSAADMEVRFKAIEQSLSSQRSGELEAMRSSNRVMLIVAGTFAGIGFLALLLMAVFQWRTINRLADIAASLPAAHAFGPAPALAALSPPSDSRLVTLGPAEQSSVRLLDALERLEKRISGLDQTAHPASDDGAPVNNEPKPSAALPAGDQVTNPDAAAAATPSPETAATTDAARINLLLGKGQSMLNLDNAEAALACFDEVLALEPNNTEGLVKKGTALERLRKLDEAIECYNRAIAADGSMTIAYLHKGGLFNRMERFSEALECYEQALRTQEKRAA